LAQQDLAGMCGVAQPRGEIRDVSDRNVVVAAFESNSSESGVAGRDADTETEVVSALSPVARERFKACVYGRRGADGGELVIGEERRIVEEGHETVGCKMLHCSVARDDALADGSVVLAQDTEDLLGVGDFRKGSEPAKVAEHRGDFAPMADEKLGALLARE